MKMRPFEGAALYSRMREPARGGLDCSRAVGVAVAVVGGLGSDLTTRRH